MKSSKWSRIIMMGVLCILLIPMAGYAQVEVTFEGAGLTHDALIGTIDGIVFGDAWVACVDSDAGGSCNIANEPSPSTAVKLDVASVSDSSETRITFPTPAMNVGFYYSMVALGGLPSVSFYSATGELLGTEILDVCGWTSCGDGCVGDPNGDLCSWTYLTFTSGSSRISYIEFSNLDTNAFVVDNFNLHDLLNRDGFWAEPGKVGGAIAIDIKGDTLSVGWGAYDSETGESSWLYSEGAMTDADHYSGPLWQFKNGQCFDCPYTPPTVQTTVGTMSITFQTDTTATIDALGVTKNVEKVD